MNKIFFDVPYLIFPRLSLFSAKMWIRVTYYLDAPKEKKSRNKYMLTFFYPYKDGYCIQYF